MVIIDRPMMLRRGLPASRRVPHASQTSQALFPEEDAFLAELAFLQFLILRVDPLLLEVRLAQELFPVVPGIVLFLVLLALKLPVGDEVRGVLVSECQAHGAAAEAKVRCLVIDGVEGGPDLALAFSVADVRGRQPRFFHLPQDQVPAEDLLDPGGGVVFDIDPIEPRGSAEGRIGRRRGEAADHAFVVRFVYRIYLLFSGRGLPAERVLTIVPLVLIGRARRRRIRARCLGWWRRDLVVLLQGLLGCAGPAYPFPHGRTGLLRRSGRGVFLDDG
mmetsp:Transcript_4738/g.12151  ORF Transcript_4738/g.12151 Transcript_4738/m.12151 type:complete len:275 (+) Transcript_4738:273-1097(+)